MQNKGQSIFKTVFTLMLTSCAVIGFTAHPAFAMQKITLKNNSAAIDLNDDGINEIIRKNNDSLPLSTFIITAKTANKNTKQPIILATLNAHSISLSNQYTYGIRDLLVFSDATNDFRYDIYAWNPSQSTYTKKQTGNN